MTLIAAVIVLGILRSDLGTAASMNDVATGTSETNAATDRLVAVVADRLLEDETGTGTGSVTDIAVPTEREIEYETDRGPDPTIDIMTGAVVTAAVTMTVIATFTVPVIADTPDLHLGDAHAVEALGPDHVHASVAEIVPALVHGQPLPDDAHVPARLRESALGPVVVREKDVRLPVLSISTAMFLPPVTEANHHGVEYDHRRGILEPHDPAR